jgi:hypothetical protein
MWLQFVLITLDESHKILVAKNNNGTIRDTKSHEDAIYTNILSIQNNLWGVVVL